MNTANLLMTDHMVDDLPESEVNLQLFQAISKFSHMNCTVSEDRRQMSYAIGDITRRNQALHVARLTIAMFSLPLIAELKVIEKYATVIKATLIITYTGK